ncbi:hypothetical protein JCM8097_007237 [Rhodosporidiobolus ruineniae]
MPPRRSTRSTKGKSKAAVVDLLSSSSSEESDEEQPRSKRARTHKQPQHSSSDVEVIQPIPSTSSKGKGRSSGGGRADEEQEDADAALARRLQDEEDAMAGVEGGQPSGSASASTSTAAQPSPRRSSRPRRGSTSISASTSAAARAPSPVEEQGEEEDEKDPRRVVRAARGLFGGEGTCRCGAKVEKKKDELPLTPTSTLPSYLSLAAATCPACNTKLCRGCWSALPNDEGRGEGECCAEGRVVVVYELLSALDTLYLADHLRKPAPPAPTASTSGSKGKKSTLKKKAAPPAGRGAGVGYGDGAGALPYNYYASIGGYAASTAGNGTGYSADPYEDGYDSFEDMDGYDSAEEDRLDWEDMYGEEYDAGGQGALMGADGGGFEAFRQKRVEERAERKRRREEKRKAAAAPPPSNAKDASQDALYLAFLTLLRPQLPAPDSPSAQIYDFLPSPLLAPLLELSTLPDLLSQLLRNDSVPEWARRSDVYFATLALLEALGGSEATLGTVFAPRRDKSWSEGLRAEVEGRGEVRWERRVVSPAVPPAEVSGKGKGKGRKRKADEEDGKGRPAVFGEVVMASPLYTHLVKLSTQAEAFRKAASSGSLDDADAALIGICGDFAAAGERFKALSAVWTSRQEAVAPLPADEDGGTGGKGKGKAKELGWSEADYVKACQKLAYETIDMSVEDAQGGKTFPTHYYHRDILAIASSRRSHHSFVHLAKELAVLSTSLPPGIWVRVDEARVDVLKCLIAGPEGSPYAGGLFEFDVFLPLTYPQVPPQCWLRTTGNNQVRFNPNLYAEGKTCLSLLGTWSGSPEEMWQPAKSTILQVLLSITSMILGTSFAFYNEPGYGAPKDNQRNKNYNKNCSLATTRWAILDWLAGTKGKDSIWSDVIASHFLLNRSTISSTIAEWAGKDDRMHKWTPSLNATAGTDRLEPFNYGRYNAAYYAGAGVVANGKGKGKKKGAAVEPEKPAGPAPRDLVKEVEAALDKLEGWKEAGWLEKLAREA